MYHNTLKRTSMVTILFSKCTDLETNQNKYYAMEIHNAVEGSRSFWRVFTHYGRTDELDDPDTSGKRECRYVSSKEQAEVSRAILYTTKIYNKQFRWFSK